jgi:ribosomal protein S21
MSMALQSSALLLKSVCRSLVPSALSCSSRGFAVSVNVLNNNVDQAVARLRKQCKTSGLDDELRKREYRVPKSELDAQKRKNKYNKQVGTIIRDRLAWLAKKNGMR